MSLAAFRLSSCSGRRRMSTVAKTNPHAWPNYLLSGSLAPPPVLLLQSPELRHCRWCCCALAGFRILCSEPLGIPTPTGPLFPVVAGYFAEDVYCF